MSPDRRRISLKSIGITSGVTIIGLASIFLTGAKWFCDTAIVPKIECIAATIDSTNHIPIMKDIAELQLKSARSDTNILIIKSILEVLATNDQLIKARQRRENPTGLR